MKKTLNAGILSYGMSGLIFHAPLLFCSEGFNIKKIWERTKTLSRKRYPKTEIVKSLKDITEDPDIDLVIVNTPDNTHFEYSLESLKQGKHVVVEKPFTLQVHEGEQLIKTAKEKGCILSVFQNRRWDGDFLTVQKIIKEEFLGRLVEFESHFDRYRNYIQESWKEDPDSGSGTIYNLGSHMIDQALVLFGKPRSVWADIRKLRDGAKVDDSYNINLEYPDVKVNLKGGYLLREQGPRYILHGTNGSFFKYGIDPQEEALKQGNWPDSSGWGTEPEKDWGILNTNLKDLHFRGKVETLAGDYPAFYRNLYLAISQGETLCVQPEDALQVIKIIEASIKSSKERKVIKL